MKDQQAILIDKLRGKCNCGCHSGGCDRPEGCRCGPSCPCQSLRFPEDIHAAADEIEHLTRELERIASCPSEECARDPFLCKAWAKKALHRKDFP